MVQLIGEKAKRVQYNGVKGAAGYIVEFESGKLDGYKTSGKVEMASGYSGEYGAKLIGNAKESSITKTLTGLTVGEDYRVTAFISTVAGATANLTLKSGSEDILVTVFNETVYCKREFVFTADATTAELKFAIPAGTPDHRYATIDEIWVLRVDEKEEGTAFVANKSADNLYTGKIDINVKSNEHKEVILKVTFANKNTDITAKFKRLTCHTQSNTCLREKGYT